MKFIQQELRERIFSLLTGEYDLNPQDIQFSIPPDRKFGDLSINLPFVLAKRLRQKPFIIGTQMVEKLRGQFDFVADIQLAGGGFLNFSFKPHFLLRYLAENMGRQTKPLKQKVVVEHTSINPNKAAHIGHLRNACLGDTLVRSLRFLDYEVEVQNYIDDTGIQMADVVWGLLHHRKKSIDGVKEIDHLAAYLWNLYSEVNRLFQADEQLLQARNEVHRKIEEKEEPEYSMGDYISRQVLRDHIRVMAAIGVRYDLLVRERDIIELDFFEEAAGILKREGIMYRSKDPQKQGCWVIQYDRENIEKVIIRSNGTVTYIGKDIAYTFWKVGLFQNDFYYQPFYTYDDAHEIFITDFESGKQIETFGRGLRVYNVIDTRQSYLQNIISQVLSSLTAAGEAEKFAHFSYEMVALTPRCVKEMGLQIAREDEDKAYVEVSGRKGIAVKADELIARLKEKSSEEVKLRNPQMDDGRVEEIAADIAVGALRYFMIKFTANTVIAFDFKEALAFEGDTGPYLQYAVVRINSILRKMEDQAIETKPEELDLSILDSKEYDVTYDLLLLLSLLEIQVEFALGGSEISAIANYTFSICQKFNHYYHLFPVIAEADSQKRNLRKTVILLVKDRLEKLLHIMGIPIPPKM